ncbi:unnamed protein product [Ceratitis capitata]|uniref:(Mediterranean fruit fly) hypothetical protein n=1 Tax=Ceratitis capitata TaxID=7213 RepID=A0A811U0Y4_CERCA|nr:unnamed protein product [Ceratitis capitata]
MTQANERQSATSNAANAAVTVTSTALLHIHEGKKQRALFYTTKRTLGKLSGSKGDRRSNWQDSGILVHVDIENSRRKGKKRIGLSAACGVCFAQRMTMTASGACIKLGNHTKK